MNRAILMCIAIVLLAYLPNYATVINVPADYPTIQQGIDASTDGDTVLVQRGTYVENVDYNGHRVVLASLFLITGDTSFIEQTVIDGDSAGSVIRNENYEDSISVLTGFTIQNGYSDMGGGVLSWQSGIHITNNIIRNNGADSLGGGICCLGPWNSNPQITNNIIEENHAEIGGGICALFRHVHIIDNTIINNHASISGGGLGITRYGDVSIIGNFIAGNISDGIGGGISFGFLCSPIAVKYNQIVRNRSAFYGGGLHWDSEYHIFIDNCLFYGNTSNQGGGIYVDSGVVTITNSILWADTGYTNNNEIFEDPNSQIIVNYCGVQGGWSGNYVLDVDPVFRNPLSNDFHLQDSIGCQDTHYSPYIDSGNPEILDSTLACNSGLGGQRSDIGAFGGGDYLQHVGVVINIPDDYPTIQRGIEASQEGDTIRIAPGTYYENIGVGNKNIVIGSHFIDEGDTSFIYNTAIDGYLSGYGPVVWINNNDSTSMLAGLTICNSGGWFGGGLSISGGNPTIKNNRIINNIIVSESYRCHGAGIRCVGTSARIINNTISNNVIEPGVTYRRNGGGISCSGEGSPIISGNTITDNSAPDYGGGLDIADEVTPIIINNRIENNSAGYGGGIVNSSSNQAIFAGNVVAYNSTNGYVGGGNIYNNLIIANSGVGVGIIGADVVLMNNIVFGNSYHDGGGIYCEFCSVNIINCIIWGNTHPQIENYEGTIQVSYSDVEGGSPGDGNIDADPMFRGLFVDFHLMSTACWDPYDSPCIDTGSPVIIDSLLDCSWGLGTILSDMGAYGGGDSATVAIDDLIESLPSRFALLQNYPNPFNPSTAIRYTLPEQSDVRIEIYNILGQKVVTLFDGVRSAGFHAVIWQADDYPSGVYFARLETTKRSESIKMVLVK